MFLCGITVSSYMHGKMTASIIHLFGTELKVSQNPQILFHLLHHAIEYIASYFLGVCFSWNSVFSSKLASGKLNNRYGSRAWLVEVVNYQFGSGWDFFHLAHGLGVDYKLILACENRWIFHTIMFDGHD